MSKILLTGSIAYDRIMDFPGYFKDQIVPDKVHSINVSFFVKDLKESFGGTAGNIAYTLSLLGVKPTILANVGAKDFSFYKAWLVKNKIDLSLIKEIKNEQTASAYIITDKSDNQIAGFYPGAMAIPITKSPLNFTGVDLAVVSPQNPIDMVKLPKIFKQKKISYIFDPGQQVTSLTGSELRSAISGSRVLIGNDYEIALVKKKTKWSNPQLLNQCEILITTLGAKGVTIKSGNQVIKLPVAKRKKTVDPTGAGDAFRSGLIKGLTKGWPLKKTGQTAVISAVYAVEQYGTQDHHFTWAQFTNRYRQNFKENI